MFMLAPWHTIDCAANPNVGGSILFVPSQHLGAFDGYDSNAAAAARIWFASHNGSDAGGSGSTSGGGSGSSDGSVVIDYSEFDFASEAAQVDFWELARGWGIPTATDISLAWMVAAQVCTPPAASPTISHLICSVPPPSRTST